MSSSSVTLASLAAKALVDKKINEPIPQACSDLINEHQKRKDWLRSKPSQYYIPMQYYPLTEEEQTKLGRLDLNQPVPEGYNFTIPVPLEGGILERNWEDEEDIDEYGYPWECYISPQESNAMINLLRSNGIILKRGDIIYNQIHYTPPGESEFENHPSLRPVQLGQYVVDIKDGMFCLRLCSNSYGNTYVPAGFNIISDFPPQYFKGIMTSDRCNLDVDLFAQQILDTLEVHGTNGDGELGIASIEHKGIKYSLIVQDLNNLIPTKIETMKQALLDVYISCEPSEPSRRVSDWFKKRFTDGRFNDETLIIYIDFDKDRY